VADGNIRSRLAGHARQNAICGSFHFDRGFVGFDLEQRLSTRDQVALLPEPGDEFSGFLRHFERRHHDTDGHKQVSGETA
jgi:hypothetical protein